MNDLANFTWDVDVTQFAVGALINFAVALVIVRYIYHPLTPNRGYAFTFLAFNPTIYFLLGLMGSIELTVGVGFGLFAIFSVLRYRTEEMPIREMTYLFILIAMPVMNSVLATGGEFFKVAIADLAIMALLFTLEREWGFTFQSTKRVTYEKIELITPANHGRLIADLEERTGLLISRVDIGRIDFLRDVAELTIHYQTPALPEDERQQGLSSEFQPVGRALLDS
jgi:hypothetical protein